MFLGFEIKFCYVLVMLSSWVTQVRLEHININHPLTCYKWNTTDTKYLPVKDIRRNAGIFFIETSCLSSQMEEITLDRRQLCTLESTARSNPSRAIHVIFMANEPLPFSETSTTARMAMNLLREYPNIHFLPVSFFKYISGTPVENLGKTLVEQFSEDSYLHASDMLKLVTLWRYGGIYFDMDVIILNSFNEMPRNFLGAESDSKIGSAAMGFSFEEFGHEYVTKMLEEYAKRFTLNSRAFMGSNFMSKVTKMICKQTSTSKMIEKGCEAIKIYPPASFYPIPWTNWTDLFDARQNARVWSLLEGSYMVHLWNKRSYTTKLRVNSYAPYVDLARTFCPKMFAGMDDYL